MKFHLKKKETKAERRWVGVGRRKRMKFQEERNQNREKERRKKEIKFQSIQMLSQNHGLLANKGTKVTKPAYGFPKTTIFFFSLSLLF
jgi:hypothetical protein